MKCPVCKLEKMCGCKWMGVIVIILIVVIGGYLLSKGGYQAPETTQPQQQQPELGVPAPGQESTGEMIVSPNGTEEPLPSEESTPSVKEISIVSSNFFFNPQSLTLTKDQPVKITFSNSGTHTFTIDELSVNASLRGSSAMVEFVPTQLGNFEYYCAVSGHRERGMFGALKIE